MSTIIQNPTVPLTASLPGGRLQVGNVITIYGEPTPGAHRFAINLVSLARSSTCVFHFDARFDQGQTVCNSNYPNSGWGHEQRSHLPFIIGRLFAFELRCLHDRLMIAVDGSHFCEFYHRAPLTEADALQIHGSVRITQVVIQCNGTYSPQPPPIFPPKRLDISHPVLPFASPIGGILGVGNQIQVHGQVKSCANGFAVNLQRGTATQPHPTIALHLNPRYQPGVTMPVVVMNSWINGWGVEQRTNSLALRPGSNFVLVIKRQQGHYEIIVNGTRLANYAHRVDADTVDSVAINGDVNVNRAIVL